MEKWNYMEKINIYNKTDNLDENEFMNNKLFATFTPQKEIEDLIKNITSNYNILYKKIFVLFIKSTNEYVLTYNVEGGNINNIPQNTVFLHRKKDYNVLYSLNALNDLIKQLNNGILDESYNINWKNYQNSILITQNGGFKQLNTKLSKIIEI